MNSAISILVTCALSFAWATAVLAEARAPLNEPTGRYLDSSDGRDWPGYGRTFGQQHYSPLTQINERTVRRLGLAWSLDLKPLENSATQPIAVDGVLYFATGLSVVQAVDASSGKRLWRYDPNSAQHAGLSLRLAWGVRGIAWWNGKIYTGTADGRLIAIDAKTGAPVWSAQTLDPNGAAHINGAPRVFDGKVIIGFAGDYGKNRGYVTTYDADTGRLLWRFYTVPSNPAEGFENNAMKLAAKTWAGEWWKFGGGGAVYNSMAYDPETKLVFLGVGGPYPLNRRVRSADQGDNLFTSAIVALDGKTGAYRWHYQLVPGDTWDYDATWDIELADLTVAGKTRKVLMQAAKNGFYYVIDRLTGKLVSAEPYVKVTWASRVDLASGRPVETAGARYPDGTTAQIWPSGGYGARSSMSMAYSPRVGLAYIPKIEFGPELFTDRGVDLKHWRPTTDNTYDATLGTPSPESAVSGPAENKGTGINVPGALVAWNPETQQAVWTVRHPTFLNGGILATGGDLVFQGTVDGTFKAYAAKTGRLLWSFQTEAPIIATPISYTVGGHQYVTVLTGLGMVTSAVAGVLGERDRLDPRSQARRVLTFALDRHATLPPAGAPASPVADPTFTPDARSAEAGEAVYGRYCVPCHGVAVIGSSHAPDLRRSGIPIAAGAFAGVVRDGNLLAKGMPAFGELSDQQLADLRQYLRTESQRLRKSTTKPKQQ